MPIDLRRPELFFSHHFATSNAVMFVRWGYRRLRAAGILYGELYRATQQLSATRGVRDRNIQIEPSIQGLGP